MKIHAVRQPSGVFNWMIGCIGPNIPTPRPFDSAPTLPLGISDSPGKPVAQAAQALGISHNTADAYWAYARAWLRVAIVGVVVLAAIVSTWPAIRATRAEQEQSRGRGMVQEALQEEAQQRRRAGRWSICWSRPMGHACSPARVGVK